MQVTRHAISPSPSNFVDPAEQLSSIDCGCGSPIAQFVSHPIGHRNRSNVASLANQINNGPMVFALLESMLGRVFLSVVDDRVFAKVLGPAPRSANCRGALLTSSRL
jgi:hypothetical protein